MGTEVLRPHDCLIDRIRGPPAMVYPRRRNAYGNSRSKKKASESSPTRNNHRQHQITILKRGQPLDLNLQRLGPKTEVRIVAPDIYAGSAFSVSPAPESLPLPTFSTKKQVSLTVDDSATRDLRRLLRLD